MAQRTISEKERFAQDWEREFETTRRVLRAFPPGRGDFNPAPPMKNAKDLAWVLALGEGLIGRAMAPAFETTGAPEPAPATYEEVVEAYERRHRENAERLHSWPDEDLERTIPFPVAPHRMGEVRKVDLCWMALMDAVHHRGQFTVYLRMVGARVPSVYGPTADEPWI